MYIASFYDSTGRIVGVMRGPRESVEATSAVTGDPFVEGEGNPDLQYVREKALASRPESPSILTRHTLSALPVPCTIRIGRAVYPCTEAEVDLEFGSPGTFQVTVEAWPYLNKEFTVENPPL
ncbi:Uncharacterised protein [Achromobacter sp. 2789STDY5608633]|jgi:hypothetical protein|uniref:Uncharacterized protein n=3 Tax=Pseudomonadati TaxID=3379134 RepID=A0A6J5HN57_9BURK|nr:hypothetical protein LMG26845_01324 [Achromobacter insuavis]CUI58409.1 Uncharacterised protein [Achromobacter sp. 2789STDY5608633]CUJ37927.1 Uncharacterised protein [Achromobacter sp. 2789STDY5608621]CUJ76304.1 Uncharacterised protein [Achromobacter sp. 2789STDY5608628]CUJ98981.1 Uncharacterised protein [Achromobacter sp. 2789STDY5608615]